MTTAFIVIFSVIAAASDLRSRRIPKWLVVAGFLAGIALHIFNHNIVDALIALPLAFIASVFLFWMGAIGGGDAKLMIALAALFGWKGWLICIAIAFVAAAVMGLLQAAWSGRLRQTFQNMWFLLTHFAVTGIRPHPELNVAQDSAMGSPFAVATAVGSFATLYLLKVPV